MAAAFASSEEPLAPAPEAGAESCLSAINLILKGEKGRDGIDLKTERGNETHTAGGWECERSGWGERGQTRSERYFLARSNFLYFQPQ